MESEVWRLVSRGPKLVGYSQAREGHLIERMTPEGIEALRRKGMNQTEIGEHFGVTRQAVSDMVRRYGREVVTVRQKVQASFPWVVDEAYKLASPCRRLRDHAEYFATDGQGMGDDKLQRLLSFYRRLRDEDVVVEYNPAFGPSPGIKTGGWRFVRKEMPDGDLIVRLNHLALPLAERDLEVWQFPEKLPRIRRTD